MKMVIGEWNKILGKKALVFILIAMTFVPLLYSSVFLSSFWDPYGKTDQIPVAVVNNDTGAVMGGKQLAIGQKFVTDLKSNTAFKWSFEASKQQALRDLEQGNYFLVIEIPANFSQNATTLMDQQPQKMQLNYYTNPGRNYPVSQITASAMTKIEGQIADAVRKQYAQTVFASLKTMADGMGKASDGSGKLDQGARALATGSETLNTNMQKLASGMLVFNNGVQDLGDGAAKLQSGLATTGDGSARLTEGLNSAVTGAATLKGGAQSLDQGLAQLATAGTRLDGGAAQTSAGAAKLNAGLQQVQAQLNAVVAGVDQGTVSGPQLQAALAQIAAAQQQLTDGAGNLATGTQQLATNIHTVSDKLAAAHAGSQKVAEGGAALQAATAQLASGSESLTTGLAQLAQGSDKLATGADRLSQASTALKDGSQKLASGSESLQQGTASLASGLGDLNSGLKAGAEQSQAVHAVTDPTYDMFASPTELAAHKAHDVPQYGAGLTPYILSIGLFSAALMFSSSYALRAPSTQPTSGAAWFLSKVSVAFPVGIISSLLAVLVLVSGLGLHVQSVWRFVLFTMVVSLTFMTMFILLAALLDKVGQFVGFIMLLLQIGSSEGTFPKVLTPPFFQHLNPLLPMTYAIRGFRQVISIGTDYGQLWQQAGILAAYAGGFALLAILVFNRLARKQGPAPVVVAAA